MTAAVLDRPTGEQLYQELAAEARRRRVSLTGLARRLWPFGPGWKLEQMRIAQRPTPATVQRVRALIAGEPVEHDFSGMPAEPALTITRSERAALGMSPSGREQLENRNLARVAAEKAELERRIQISRLAHDRKLPGETLHAATTRLMMELAA